MWRAAVRAPHYGDIVLLVTGDPPLQDALAEELHEQGYRAVLADSPAALEQLAMRVRPIVILLDLDGRETDVLAHLRERCAVPLVALSSRGKEADKVAALGAGADDYIVKPFRPKEVLARIRVALRDPGAHGRLGETIEVGPIHIDPARYTVTVDERSVHLTPIELRVLTLLARFRGAVVTREQILYEVWGSEGRDGHLLRVHIAALRKKLELDPAAPRWLRTVVGIGYRLGV